MPILNHSDLKKVEEYQNFVRTSPYANATQDLAWEKVKEGWTGEQVYLEENGKIVAAMSLIIRRVLGNFSLMYAPRAPICDFHDKEMVKRLLEEAKPLAKKYHAFLLRFDPGNCQDFRNWKKSTVRWGCASAMMDAINSI